MKKKSNLKQKDFKIKIIMTIKIIIIIDLEIIEINNLRREDKIIGNKMMIKINNKYY